MQQSGKTNFKFKIDNLIHDEKHSLEEPLDIHQKRMKINVILSKNQSILQQIVLAIKTLSLMLTTTFYSIKILPVNVLVLEMYINMWQIIKKTLKTVELNLPDNNTTVDITNPKKMQLHKKLRSLKEEVNLKAISIKRNLLLKIES